MRKRGAHALDHRLWTGEEALHDLRRLGAADRTDVEVELLGLLEERRIGRRRIERLARSVATRAGGKPGGAATARLISSCA